MGQKVSGGIHRTGSRDGSSNQLVFPEQYRRALAAAAAAAAGNDFGAGASGLSGNMQGISGWLDFYQDFVRPSRLDIILTLPPLPKEVQV